MFPLPETQRPGPQPETLIAILAKLVKQREPVRTGLHSKLFVQWQAQECISQNERAVING